VADDVKPVRFPPRKSNVNKTKSGKSADDL